MLKVSNSWIALRTKQRSYLAAIVIMVNVKPSFKEGFMLTTARTASVLVLQHL